MKLKASTLPEDRIDIPPGWLTRKYLTLNPPAVFERKDIGNDNLLDQFLRRSARYHMVKKLDRGKYFAADPCTAINCWAVEDYFAQILLLNSLFSHLKIPYCFLCLSTYMYSDYVPERPMVVTREDNGYKEIQNFVFDFSDREIVKLEVLKKTYDIPVLNKEDTGLLLLSTYLSREVKAGKEILGKIEVGEETKYKLLRLGYIDYGGERPVTFEVELPDWIKEKQKKVGIGRLKEVATR